MSRTKNTRGRLCRTVVAGVLAALALPAAVAAGPTPAGEGHRPATTDRTPDVSATRTVSAAATVYGVSRSFTSRFTTNLSGDLSVIGNSNLSCSTNLSGCVDARNRIGTKLNNNDWGLVRVDVDDDPQTTDSTTANFLPPDGSTVVWAGLYWAGIRPSNKRTDPRVSPPTEAERTVKFKIPGDDDYVDVIAENFDVLVATGADYSAFAEVTDLVKEGGRGTYTVANIWGAIGANTFAGWALAVIWADNGEPVRSVSVFDGSKLIGPGAPATVTLTGLQTPDVGPVKSTLGFFATEGDFGAVGDTLRLNGVPLSVSGARPSNNFFNSSFTTRSADYVARTPDYLNAFGLDAGLVAADGILPVNATTATLQAATVGDYYGISMLALSTELYAPKFTETISISRSSPPWNDATDAASPGDVLTFTFTTTNTGLDGAVGAVLRTLKPDGFTLVPGSFTINGVSTSAMTPNPVTLAYPSGPDGPTDISVALGGIAKGATVTVTYQVTVENVTVNPNGTVRAIDFAVTGTGATSGIEITEVSEQLRIPINPTTADLGVTALWYDDDPTAGGDTLAAGVPAKLAIKVRNEGPADAGPVTISATVPAGLAYRYALNDDDGDGETVTDADDWECTLTGDTDGFGGTVTCVIAYIEENETAPRVVLYFDVPADTTAGTTVTVGIVRDASLPVDPNAENDSDTVTATIVSVTDLAVTAGRESTGDDEFEYTLAATNLGPSDASSTANEEVEVETRFTGAIEIVGAVGSGWDCTVDDDRVRCRRDALAVGETSTISIQTLTRPTATTGTVAEIGGGGLDRFLDNNVDRVETGSVPGTPVIRPPGDGLTPPAAGRLPAPERVAGPTRIETAVALSAATFARADVVYVATGATYADALVAGPPAGLEPGPILLVERDAIPAVVLGELDRLGPRRIIVVGGPAAISPAVEATLAARYPAVERIGGTDRFDTAVELSRHAFGDGASTVYVAVGTDFADALSGVPTAGLTPGPILLVLPDRIPEVTAGELTRLAPQRIVVLGGTRAVGTAVETELARYAATVERIAGADRYLTGVRLSRATFPVGASVVYLASGVAFADALAAGPAAIVTAGPVLLTRRDCVPAAVLAELERLSPERVIIVGGVNSVDADVGRFVACGAG